MLVPHHLHQANDFTLLDMHRYFLYALLFLRKLKGPAFCEQHTLDEKMCLSELVLVIPFLLFCVSPSVTAQCMDGVENVTKTKGIYLIVQPCLKNQTC